MNTDSPCTEQQRGHYTCYRTKHPIVVDGKLNDSAWNKAPKSSRFIDMAAGTPGFYDTRMASLWDPLTKMERSTFSPQSTMNH